MGRPRPIADENLVKAAGYKIRYHPFGAAKDLFTDRSDEILLGGPAGTGKSLGALHKCHLMLSKYPGSKGFMARKTRTSMTNSCMATYQEHVLKPPDKVHLHKQDQAYYYPNGSMMAIVGLDDPERIKSTDWDFGYVQEVTECQENDWEICTTRLRHWKMPYQQMLGDCNPDKPTHWMKRRCDTGLTKMLVSHHEDNPRLWNHASQEWTPEGQAYLKKLQRLTGVRRARLYSGQWVAAEGVVYEMWDQMVHMINRSQLPADWDTWPHYWSIDFGFTHPFVWQDWIEAPNGKLYLNRQIYRTKSLVEDLAEEIMELTQGYQPLAIICDHDAEGRATFERHTGYLTLGAYKIIQPGIQAVQKRLELDEDKCPGIYILRDSLVSVDEELKELGSPYKTEDEWDGYVWDEKRNLLTNSKKDEVPVDKDNHGMDAARYMVAFADSIADDPQEEEDYIFHEDQESYLPY